MQRFGIFSLFFGVMLLLCGAGAGAVAAEIQLDSGGGHYSFKTKTLKDQHFREVVRQRYDFSCGSAALATLLTYHYARPVDEKPVLDAMFEQGDQEKIKREGFSLLDMKNYLLSLGLKADGFRDSLDKLTRVGIPAVVLINYHGYLHFIVVKGVTKTEVLVGDPTHGLRKMPRPEFEKMWNGILFVVLNDMKTARQHFNLASSWQVLEKGRMSAPLAGEDIGSLTVHIAQTPNYY